MPRFAAIDCGTNTILMLIADIDSENLSQNIISNNNNKNLRIIRDCHSIARLGQDLEKTSKISPEAVIRASNILINYKNICDELKVDKIRFISTQALRQAENKIEVSEILSDAANATLEVIDGNEEARLSFIGTIDNKEQSIVLDIGGGSSEIIYGVDNNILNRYSLPIGAVSITEKFFSKQPISDKELESAKNYIKSIIQEYTLKDFTGNMYAVAGTATTLGMVALGLKEFEESKVHGYEMSKENIFKILNIFQKSTLKELIDFFGIHPQRADVITAGTLILSEFLNILNKENFIVSTKGLRYGIIKSMI